MTKRKARTKKLHPNPGSLLRFLRVAKDHTLKEVQEKTDIPVMTICNMEHGIFGNFGIAKKLADYFGVSVDALVNNRYDQAADAIQTPIEVGFKQRTMMRKTQQQQEAQGDLAERLVLAHERKRLAGTKFERLVNANFADELGAGFDLMSFDSDHPIYIEVKSTKSKNPLKYFYMTINELRFAQYCKENGLDYRLYRVYGMRKSKFNLVIYSLPEVLEANFEPAVYRVTMGGKGAQV